MKTKINTDSTAALTLVEVLVVVGALVVLVALFLPSLARVSSRAPGINCANNLKQVGLAFRIWAGDNGDQYPMRVSVTNGGTMELVASGTVWQHFQVLSNELNTPIAVGCPGDERRYRTNFLSAAVGDTQPDFGDNTAVSYFVGVDSADTQPGMLLAGDRQILRDGKQLPPGLHSLIAQQKLGWPKKIHWAKGSNGKGNVALTDGSVQAVDGKGLRLLLKHSGVATSRLAIP